MDGKMAKSVMEVCGPTEPLGEDMWARGKLLALLNELIEKLIELGLEEQDESKVMRYFAAAKLIRFIEEKIKRGKL